MKKNIYGVAIILLILTSCGYKPITTYSSKRIDKVFVRVDLDVRYPRSYAILKDAIIKRLIQKLNATAVKDINKANHHILVTLQRVTFKPIEFKEGFVEKYRTYARYKFVYQTKDNAPITKIITATYDYKSEANTLYNLLLEEQQNLAVNSASLIAVEQFLASLIQL